jgi:hypothetical protein
MMHSLSPLFFALIPAAMILLSSQAFAQSSETNDLWYFGKGIQQDTYLKYRIYDNSTRDITSPSYNYTKGIPVTFDIIIYFERQDNNTGSWSGQVFVIANNTVTSGTYQEDPSRKQFNVIFGNPEMKPYYYEYLSTIETMSNFAVKPGSSLNAHEWVPVPEFHAALNGTQNITVPAGTFNCTVLLSGGPYSIAKTWINKDLPYPVKGIYPYDSMRYVWNPVTQEYVTVVGEKKHLTEFELLETGQGYPKVTLVSPNNNVAPLKQIAHGVLPENVVCAEGLTLIKKLSDGSPACVKPDTGQKLVERGWGVLNEQTVWFEYQPIACQSTPWDDLKPHIYPAWGRAPSELYFIKQYFKAQGITLIEVMRTPIDIFGPAIICGEPTYYRYYFLVTQLDENKMLNLGFKKVDTISSSARPFEN